MWRTVGCRSAAATGQQRLQPTLLLLEDRVGRTGQHDHFARSQREPAAVETGARQRSDRVGEPLARIRAGAGSSAGQRCAAEQNSRLPTTAAERQQQRAWLGSCGSQSVRIGGEKRLKRGSIQPRRRGRATSFKGL